MTEAGDRLTEGMEEALAVAKGEQPAMRLRIDGWTYVPEAVLVQKVNDAKHHAGLKFDMLAAKAKNLVALLDDAVEREIPESQRADALVPDRQGLGLGRAALPTRTV